MKRRTKGALIALAVGLLLVLALGRVFLERRNAAQAAAAPPKAPVALELAPGDVVTAATRELVRTIVLSGSVRAVDSAFVKARIAAEITRITVREGDRVRKGQALVQQDTTEFDWRLRQADQQAASARAQVQIAQRTLANNKALVDQGFISPTALESSVSSEAGAQATLQAAMAGVELARKARTDATLTAPIDGIVAQRLAQPGERVAVDTKILEIVDLSRLEIEAALAPDDVAALRVGSRARLHVDGIAGEIGASVARINPSAQAGSRALLVYLALEPHASLRQGLFARGRVELARRRALTVPTSALRLDQSRQYVLVVAGGNVVQRAVLTGASGVSDGVDVVEVLEGVTEGAQVLAGSVGAVREGTAVRMAAAAPQAAPPAASAAASAASR
ncbi:MAG TPA: efflux RND transporter periplasmic adaptor subunit [Rubrivivax sp.]